MVKNTALINAVLVGDTNQVLALATPETVNIKGNLGKTALQSALIRASTPNAIINALLDNGADVNTRDDAGHTPLSDAGKGARTIDDVYAKRACQLIDRGALWPDTELGDSAWRKLPDKVQELFTKKLIAYEQQQALLQKEKETKAFGLFPSYAMSLNTQSSNSSGLRNRNVTPSTELKTFN